MNKRAVVVVDLQNEYLPTGKLALTGIHDALNNAARVIADARTKGDLVIHIRHESTDPDAPFFTPGTDAVQIHDTVAPAQGEPVIVKNFPNAFRKTELKALLDEHGVEEVTVIGAMSHMCMRLRVQDHGRARCMRHARPRVRRTDRAGRAGARRVHVSTGICLRVGGVGQRLPGRLTSR
jgi:nicotinamidase-related amidase